MADSQRPLEWMTRAEAEQSRRGREALKEAQAVVLVACKTDPEKVRRVAAELQTQDAADESMGGYEAVSTGMQSEVDAVIAQYRRQTDGRAI